MQASQLEHTVCEHLIAFDSYLGGYRGKLIRKRVVGLGITGQDGHQFGGGSTHCDEIEPSLVRDERLNEVELFA